MLRMRTFVTGLFAISLLAAAGGTLRADELRRRGMIGVQLAPLPDADKEKLKLTTGAILVQEVMPGMAAEKSGVKRGDVVYKIGDETFADLQAGLALMRKYYTGDKVKLSIMREGAETSVDLVIGERPRETSDDFEVVYDSAGEAGKRVRTIITKPKGGEKHAAVLFLPSLNPMTIEFAQPMMARHPYKQICDRMTAAGFVVMRVERPGNGDSEGSDPRKPHLADDLAAYTAALAKLRSYPYVDGNRVYLLSHSLGSVVAAPLAAQDKVAGIITYAAIGKPLADSILDTMAVRWKLDNVPADEMQKNSDALRKFYTAVLSEGKSPADALKDNADATQLTEGMVEGESIMGSHYSYWQELAKRDYAADWKKVDAPVLVLWGESDFMAPRTDSEAVVAAVNAGHAGAAAFDTVPKTDHQFDTAQDAEESYLAGFSGNFNNSVIEKITEWIKKTQKS